MKKSIKSFVALLLIVAMTLSIVGCGKSKKEAKEPLPTLSPFATPEEKDAYYKKLTASIKVEKANGKYEYDQEDNSIDDKYRNFYEIMVATFCDSNNDGIGDLNGVTSKLDYIKDMGYNGIWLTPIMESPSYHKYDVTDYMSIDKQFGTIDDFKKLADECKRRNICLIIDLVINHTSTSHPWFIEAKKNLGNAKNKYFNYYNFTKEQKGDTYYSAGNNWYYEAEFWDQMPDLNLNNTEVRAEIEKIISYWLGLGIGGFRLDAVIHYEEDNTDENVKILKWLNDYVKKINPDAYIVGEAWDNSNTVANYYASGVDSFFNFDFGGSNGVITGVAKSDIGATLPSELTDKMIKYQDLIKSKNKDAIDAPFLSNHDMDRSYGYVSGDEGKVKLAIGLYQMLNGATFTYYGEEIGMPGSGDKDVNFRASMYWSKTDNGEQPDSPEGCTVNNTECKFGSVEEQQKDNNSVLNYTKRILQLKNENPEIARGTVTELTGIKDKDVVAFKKTYNNSSIIVIVNTTSYPKKFKVDKSNGYSGIRGYATTDDTVVTLDNDTLTMSGNSLVILK